MIPFQRLSVPVNRECLLIQNPDIEVEKICDSLFVLKPGYGMGSCVGLFIGPEFLLLVDSMRESSSNSLMHSIREISSLPIRIVINTHGHEDHCGGNKTIKELGAIIVAHNNVRYEPDISADTLFEDVYEYEIGNEHLSAVHFEAHSFSDAIIRFKKSNVLFMGDIFPGDSMPLVGTSQGISGLYRALDYAIAISNSETTIVSGHGTLSNRDGLMEIRKTWTELLERGKALHNLGYSGDDISNDCEMFNIATRFAPSIGWNIRHQWLKWGVYFMLKQYESAGVLNIPSDHLDCLCGAYVFGPNEIVEVQKRGGTLYICEKNRYRLPVRAISNTTFESQNGRLKFEFVVDDSCGKVSLLRPMSGSLGVGLKICL